MFTHQTFEPKFRKQRIDPDRITWSVLTHGEEVFEFRNTSTVASEITATMPVLIFVIDITIEKILFTWLYESHFLGLTMEKGTDFILINENCPKDYQVHR